MPIYDTNRKLNSKEINKMKVLVTYSSSTGNTKKLAEGIFYGLQAEEKTILPIKDVQSLEEYDTVLVGYWVDRAGPNKEAKQFMESISDKTVGIFATLAYWPDTDHGYQSLKNGEEIVKEKNKVVGKFICQGKLSDAIIKQFEKMPAGDAHAINPEKLRRYEIGKNHPSDTDIAFAVELFNDRLAGL